MRCAEAVRLERQLKECQAAYEDLRRRLERELGTLSRRHYLDLTNRLGEAERWFSRRPLRSMGIYASIRAWLLEPRDNRQRTQGNKLAKEGLIYFASPKY